jgi:glycosyltransferase involved in cell wall biosynthesis
MKTKTLVILSPGFAADETDTVCLPAQQEFILSIKNNFPDINIIVLAFQYPFFESTYEWNGVHVISFNGRNRGKLYRVLLWRKIWNQLEDLSKENDLIGLISFWYGECAFIGKRFSDRFLVKHYCWILGQDARPDNKYVTRTGLKAADLMAMSDFLSDEFYRNYSIRPSKIIPNGIRVNDASSIHDEKDIDVIGVGSLIPLKRWDLFIDCINSVREKYPGIRAVICGKGDEEYRLRKQVEALQLQNALRFAGELSHGQVVEMMRRSKVLLHPSSYEGFSTVCLEALSTGTQVISFCRAMNEAITGWHIVHTNEEMHTKLVDLLFDNSLDFIPYVPYSMNDSARKLMDLFYQPATYVQHLV